MTEYLSLGWGVQSWALAAMSALGDLPKVIAIHSDTTRERSETYAFARDMSGWLADRGVVVETVVASQNAHMLYPASGNVFMPAFTANGGQLRRQCTGRWKVEPFTRRVKELSGDTQAVVWLGISWDEMTRARPSRESGITNRFPLLERKMTRMDCVRYLDEKGLPVPPKSACYCCPLHSTTAWRELSTADRERAVALDEQLRGARAHTQAGDTFLSARRIPLARVIEGIDMQDALIDTCESGYCFV